MSRTLVAYIFVFALALRAGLSYARVLVGEPISKPVRGLRAGSSGIIEEPYSFDPAAWGEGAAGQLGDGFAVDRQVPTPVLSN